ncbi:hypothetical protein PTKIN_Ptkin03bG0106000 [Pterospermum kingtungense]
MEISGIVYGVPLFLLFIFSSIFVNLIQVACYLTIRPLSKSTFRRINGAVVEMLWLQSVWMMEWWSGLEVNLHTEFKTYQSMGKEHAILMPNHVSDADVLLTWILAQRSGCLRSALSVVKKSTQYLPIFGWTLWFYEFIFVDRNWARDGSKLKLSFEALKDFPMPFWITIFVEGTRLTPDKLIEAQTFASSKGLPIPKNVLIPKTKVKVHIKRYSTKELPESDEGIAQWCRNRFIAKDALLEKFAATSTFDEEEIPDSRRSIKSLIVRHMHH